MKSITITINTENAAFEPAPEMEVSRILMELSVELGNGHLPESLRDYNGNKVGTVKVTE